VGWAESTHPNLNPNPNLILLLPAPHLAFHRPKPKETSAFPKSYPLRNCATGDEMDAVNNEKNNGAHNPLGLREPMP
jgi:hypothetical protein